MEYLVIAFMCIVIFLAYNEIFALKKVIQNQEKRLNELAKRTGHEDLSSFWISDELKEEIIQLKRKGNGFGGSKTIG